MTYGIIYGFAEGPWVGKQLRTAMDKAGFKFTGRTTEADIILAHSAGCYFLPVNSKRQLVVLIGPPYWPGKPLILCMLQKIWRDFTDAAKQHQLNYWLRKTCWNLYYLLKDLLHALHIGQHAHRHNFHESLHQDHILVVRNQDDAWQTPDIATLFQKFGNVKYVELPGQHDDCWINPQPYVDLIQSVHE